LISIQYKTTNERHTFGFDERNKNRKYLAESDGYDENKNLIEHISYRPDGQVEQHVVYVYEDGLLKDEYRLNKGGRETLYKTSYTYNTNRTLIYSTISSFERRIKKDTSNPWKDVFDELDFEKTKSWGDIRITKYNYDSKGNLIKKHTESGNSTEGYESYNYNDEGRVIEETTVSSGQITRKITTTYFQDSLETICIFYPYESGNICKKKFDKNNNLIIEQCDETPSKKHWFTRKYFYDSKNRIIKEEYITDIGNSIFTLYEYKDTDKPISKVFAVNNK
jgi:YD repeat-containing protein